MRATLLCCLTLIACGDNNINNNGLEDMSMSQDVDMEPDQGTMSCDPIQQDCPAGQKCALAGFGTTATISCVMAGTVGEGMACMRSMGADNCAAGLTCSRNGSVCRKYCTADTDCVNGQKCAAGRGGTPVGTCSPSCTPFGTDCGALNCSTLATAFAPGGGVFFTCRMPGNTANFDDCTGGAICGANAFCDATASWCAPLCDDNHACPALSGDGGVPVSCQSLQTGLAGDPGYCAQ
jgi:hypothetical protein